MFSSLSFSLVDQWELEFRVACSRGVLLRSDPRDKALSVECR